MQMTILKAPLSKCSLSSLNKSTDKNYLKNSIKALCLIFDTKEDMTTKGLNFEETMA
jgi:hypothetical protein